MACLWRYCSCSCSCFLPWSTLLVHSPRTHRCVESACLFHLCVFVCVCMALESDITWWCGRLHVCLCICRVRLVAGAHSCVMHHATIMQHAICSTQHAARNMQHATRMTQHATRTTQHATRNMQHGTCALSCVSVRVCECASVRVEERSTVLRNT